jgi:hypothetical protein
MHTIVTQSKPKQQQGITIMQTMTHYEVIRTHIEASSPCSLEGVMRWATAQGFGGFGVAQAIQTLKTERVIDTSFDDDNNVIIDLV